MRALDRILAVFEAVAGSETGATMSAVASRTNMSLATVSRLMREMSAAGLLTRSSSGSYQLGPHLITLAQASTRRGTLADLALPILQDLRDASGETAALHVRVGDRRVCVAALESPQEVRRVVAVGLSLPLLAGATGLALLARLPPDEQATCLAELALSDRETLISQLAQISRSGYAWAISTVIRGVSGVAAPVMERGSAVAVLSVSGPSSRWSEEPMKAFAPTLMRAAEELSQLISGGEGAVHHHRGAPNPPTPGARAIGVATRLNN